MRVSLSDGALLAELDDERRCLSSAVLGGGLASMRTWLDLQVPADYARTDPDVHLAERAAGLRGPVVGMLTAFDVARYTSGSRGSARALATVGIAHPLAAAGRRPRALPAPPQRARTIKPAQRPGTINVLALVDVPLTDAGLAGALTTAVEAKVQALADAGILARNANGLATGTATDSVCVACPLGACEPFAGPATPAGADLAGAVHAAVLAGALAGRARDVHPGQDDVHPGQPDVHPEHAEIAASRHRTIR